MEYLFTEEAFKILQYLSMPHSAMTRTQLFYVTPRTIQKSGEKKEKIHRCSLMVLMKFTSVMFVPVAVFVL